MIFNYCWKMAWLKHKLLLSSLLTLRALVFLLHADLLGPFLHIHFFPNWRTISGSSTGGQHLNAAVKCVRSSCFHVCKKKMTQACYISNGSIYHTMNQISHSQMLQAPTGGRAMILLSAGWAEPIHQPRSSSWSLVTKVGTEFCC